MAQPSSAEQLTAEALPDGWEMIELPGHSFDMTGFRTPDNNIYIGDCVSSKETLAKYGIGYLWDPEEYVNTLEKLKTLKANTFVPAHAPVSSEIAELAQININAANEVCRRILELCGDGIAFEDLLQKVFEAYGLTMNASQYVLIGSTVRSYLSYLQRIEKIDYSFENNFMLWHSL